MVREYPTGLRKLVGVFPEGDIDIHHDKLSNLKELRTSRIPKKLVDGLRFMSQLRKLELLQYPNTIGVAIWCDSIQYLTLLEELDLCHVNIGDVGKHLRKLPFLKILKLYNCRSPTSSGVAELSTALDGIPQLVELDLEDNHLGDEGVTILSKHLCKVPQLQRLSLENNRISTNGLEKLSTALPGISQLKNFQLSYNPLGGSVVSLASHLSSVPQLERSKLCDVNMTGAGVLALSETFRHMHFLTCLDFSMNTKVDNGSWSKFADDLHYLAQLRLFLLVVI